MGDIEGGGTGNEQRSPRRQERVVVGAALTCTEGLSLRTERKVKLSLIIQRRFWSWAF